MAVSKKGQESIRLILVSAIVSIFVISGVVATPRSYAFANGQSASLIIGQPNFTSQASGTTASALSSPEGIAFDSSGNLWVADAANSRVLEFKAPLSADEDASVVLGKPNFTTSIDACSGSTFVNAACLNVPSAVALDSSGNLWVTDSSDQRVLEYTPPFTNGENASLVIGRANFTTGNNPDESPSATNLSNGIGGVGGLTFDSSGNLWVADTGWNRVLEFKAPLSNGEAASTVIGQQNFTAGVYPNYPGCALGQACPTASSLEDPIDVKFDSSGNLWVADSTPFRILEFKAPFTNGMSASLVLGEPDFTTYRGGSIISCDVTPSASCVFPYALSFDKSGALWASDAGFSRLLRFNPPFANDENASLVLGQPDFVTGPPASGTSNASATNIGSPFGVAVDPSGNVWVSDQSFNRILEFGSSSSSSSSSTPSTSSSSISTFASSITTSTLRSTTVASSSTSAIVTTTSTLHTTSSSTSTSNSLTYVAVIVVVVIVIGAAGFLVVRRRGSSP